MISEQIYITKVSASEKEELLKIGIQTFYATYGPPVNTEENIQNYLKENFTLEQINRELNHPNSQFYFVKIDDKTVGYIKLNSKDAQTEPIKGNGLEIERIYVIKEYQGKKIGNFLVEKAKNVAQTLAHNFVWLGVWDQNLKAIQFYQKNGFKTFDNHQFKLGSELQNDLLMKYEL